MTPPFGTPRHVLQVLLVEDNPADARLAREAFAEAKVPSELHVATDGSQALAYLRKEGRFADAQRPDLILLDLNLPRTSGREVLATIKADPELHRIPVIVLSTSASDGDITAAYDLHANSYLTKPLDLDEFIAVIQQALEYWLRLSKLPS